MRPRRLLAVLAPVAAGTLLAAVPASAPMFRDVSKQAAIDISPVCGAPVGSKSWLPETIGTGAGWLDFDKDGSLDLYVINGSTFQRAAGMGELNRLYRGDGRGRFTDVTAASGTGHRGWGTGLAAGDYDGDGDTDLYVTNLGPNVLYRNNGDGTFSDVTAASGTAGGSWSTSAAWFDAEGDGDLDLYVCKYVAFDLTRTPARGAPETRGNPACTQSGIPVVCGPRGLPPAQDQYYRNNGNGTFTDATRAAGMHLETPRYGLAVATGDFDNDGDADIYVANDSVPNLLWRNDGGKFTDVGLQTLSALTGEGTAQAGMGTDFGDFDGDGWLDLVVTNFSQDVKRVYRNEAGKRFHDVSLELGLGATFMRLSWGTGWRDFDLDGDQDLFLANGHIHSEVDDYGIGTRFRQPCDLFLNPGPPRAATGARERFQRAPATGGLGLERSYRGAAFGDYDNDGDDDLFLTTLGDPPVLLRNETRSPDAPAAAPHFVSVLPVEPGGRASVGARVSVTVAGRTLTRELVGGGSYLAANDPRLIFGLGAAAKFEGIEIRWPGGSRSRYPGGAADRFLVLRRAP